VPVDDAFDGNGNSVCVHLSPWGRGRPRAGRVRGMERFKQRARKLRSLQTSAEARLSRGLRNRSLAHWKFRRQHPIDRYVVDFVTLDGKLIVEVDGVTHSSERETLRDAQRTLVLDSLGFRVIRVTNVDIYENLAGVLEMIYHELCHD
ncbi:MAG: endonuclease domain-containing protein, partial [Rhodoplanes sp.]